jgi:hypothetical protein
MYVVSLRFLPRVYFVGSRHTWLIPCAWCLPSPDLGSRQRGHLPWAQLLAHDILPVSGSHDWRACLSLFVLTTEWGYECNFLIRLCYILVWLKEWCDTISFGLYQHDISVRAKRGTTGGTTRHISWAILENDPLAHLWLYHSNIIYFICHIT